MHHAPVPVQAGSSFSLALHSLLIQSEALHGGCRCPGLCLAAAGRARGLKFGEMSLRSESLSRRADLSSLGVFVTIDEISSCCVVACCVVLCCVVSSHLVVCGSGSGDEEG